MIFLLFFFGFQVYFKIETLKWPYPNAEEYLPELIFWATFRGCINVQILVLFFGPKMTTLTWIS